MMQNARKYENNEDKIRTFPTVKMKMEIKLMTWKIIRRNKCRKNKKIKFPINGEKF